MIIHSRRPANIVLQKTLVKQEEKKVERKKREKKVIIKKEEPILPLVEEALASVEE